MISNTVSSLFSRVMKKDLGKIIFLLLVYSQKWNDICDLLMLPEI